MRPLRLCLAALALVVLAAPGAAQIVWVVDDVADPLPITGTLTLRQAITGANAMPGSAHSIQFQIPGPGVHVIALQSPLPAITGGGVWVNGYSQPGASAGPTPPSTATILIQIDGAQAGPAHGLWLLSTNNRVEGLSIVNFQYDGIRVEGTPPPGTSMNDIHANFVGVDATGTMPMGNGYLPGNIWAGIDVLCTPGPFTLCFNNIVHQNLVSGNFRCGIQISSCPPSDCYANHVDLNWVGLDVAGMQGMGNLGSGIVLAEGTHDNQVLSNRIAANGGNGIDITGNDYTQPPTNTLHNTFSTNRIGYAVDMVTPLGNAGRGVSLGIFEIASYFAGFCPENTFTNNLIGNSGMAGIGVWEHPLTATNADGNTFQMNTYRDNIGLSIDLDDDGQTFNDPGDIDAGANQDLNTPIMMTANWVAGTTTLTGTVDGGAEVHLYRGAVDPTGMVEGDAWLASVWPDALGNWSLAVTNLAIGDFVLAHAMDWAHGAYSNTSEFCDPIVVQRGTAVAGGDWLGRFGLAVSGANPFRGETAFTCALPAAGAARLALYDCAGRRVRTLLDRHVEAGALPVAWDGRDDGGRELPAGVYLARLSAGDEQGSGRVVKLR
jgi:hypothetical protein